MFIRDIQNAPRDARYKIDHYYKEGTKEDYTISYPYLNFHVEVIELLNLDETFNWKERLVDTQGEYTFGDFTIGYRGFTIEEMYGSAPFSNHTVYQFYFKYKGELNKLNFKHNPELVDYNSEFWKTRKNQPATYNDVDTLLHNIRYFIQYKKISPIEHKQKISVFG